MSAALVRRTGLTCLSLVAIVLLVVLTRVTASSPVLEACINGGNGMMRLVGPSTACHNNESRVNWNVQGLQGLQGPIGPEGPIGPDGLQGIQGIQGIQGLQGVQGIQGEEGPAGSSSGPPFVWVCTPANYDIGNNSRAEIDIFNGGGATANVTTHFFAKNGTNLAGATIPGTSPTAAYPSSATVTLGPANTLIIPYQTGAGIRADDNALMASVRVTSDQPIVVGSMLANGPPNAIPCNNLHM